MKVILLLIWMAWWSLVMLGKTGDYGAALDALVIAFIAYQIGEKL